MRIFEKPLRGLNMHSLERHDGLAKLNVLPILFIFMTVFSFRLPVVYNSLIFAAGCAFLLGFRSAVFWNEIRLFVGSKYVFGVLKSYFVIFFLITLVLLYSASTDLTIFRGFVSVAISLACTGVVVAFLLCKYDLNATEMMRIVLYAMCLQSLIQLAAFLSPAVLSVVQFFQNEGDSQMLQEGYGGLRGLALSGELTFALSATYGFSFITLFYLVAKSCLPKTSAYVIGFLLVVGSMFAGRTAFVGLGFGVIYYFSASEFKLRRLLLRTLANVVMVGLISYALFALFSNEQTEALLRFAFEFVYAYVEGKSVETESTNILIESLNLAFSIGTFFFGDGQYTNADGSYYMKIDSGYFRQILFGGLAFLLACFLNQLAMLKVFLAESKFERPDGLRSFAFFVFFYLAFLHVKGEAVAYIKFVQVIVFVWSLTYLHEKSRERAGATSATPGSRFSAISLG
jgi:hypothetical protein